MPANHYSYQKNTPIIVHAGVDEEDEEEAFLIDSHNHNNNSSTTVHTARCNRHAVGVVAVVFLVIVVATVPFRVLFGGGGGHFADHQQSQLALSSFNPQSWFGPKTLADRPCTFDECFATRCNADVAPYTCLFNNGGPHGGCSQSSWLTGTCTEQCDLSLCSGLEIPDSASSCAAVKCTKSWCTEQPQLCPADAAPYQCTDGAARYGCSADPYQWTLKVSTDACSACCDTSSC
jgi:hypothetical protein